MTPEQLAVYAGIVLSLFMSYFPPVANWYNGLEAAQKVQVMGGLLVIVALAVFGLSCAGLYPLVACSVAGAKELLNVLLLALMANQTTYLFAVRPFKSAASAAA
jgi:hypothetical protein